MGEYFVFYNAVSMLISESRQSWGTPGHRALRWITAEIYKLHVCGISPKTSQNRRSEGDPAHIKPSWTLYEVKKKNVWFLSLIRSCEASLSGPCSPPPSRTRTSTTASWRATASRTRSCLRIQSSLPPVHRCTSGNHLLVLWSGNDLGWVAQVEVRPLAGNFTNILLSNVGFNAIVLKVLSRWLSHCTLLNG